MKILTNLRDTPIRKKLLRFILLTSLLVFLISGVSYSIYEYFLFKKISTKELTIMSQIVASNSTAALVFDSPEEATEILGALKADPHITEAALYNERGELFSKYPVDLPGTALNNMPQRQGYYFEGSSLYGVQPVMLNGKQIGILYVKSDLEGIYDRLQIFGTLGIITLLVIVLLGYYLSLRLQQLVSRPILELATTARAISENADYSVRATKTGDDELGFLTDSFNQMLSVINDRNSSIHKAQERIENIIETMGDAFVSLNPDWEYTIVNDKALELMNKNRDDLIGKTLWEIFPDIIGSKFEKEYRNVMEKRVPAKFEIFYPSYQMWLEVRSNPHDDGIAIFYSDITERMQSANKIQAQLSRLDLLSHITRAIGERQDLYSIFLVTIQSLEDNLPIDFGCVYMLDKTKDKLQVKCIGKNSNDLLKNNHIDIKALNKESKGLSKVLDGLLIYEEDLRNSQSKILKKLAGLGLNSVVISPLAVESKAFGLLVCGRTKVNGFSSGDCEFLKQLSEHIALATHNTELHEALQMAYDDLRNTQNAVLQQERLKALGQMSSGIAHDINNAISPISLYTESILELEPNLSEKSRNYLVIIQQSIDDVTKTVARMREFYRQKEPQLNLTQVNLNILIQQVVDLTQAKWSNIPLQQGIVITVTTDLATDLPKVSGIENELREALTNLIFNAVDAMPAGGELKIRTNLSEVPFDPKNGKFGKFVILEITDTGIGMDDETRKRCLEPFYTTKGERGTGLGLSMVFGVIQRHSADLEIDSEPSKGSTFRIIFSIKSDLHHELPVKELDIAPKRKRILIIDDDPLVLKSLNDVLDLDGHIVTTAYGGKEGISIFLKAFDSKIPVDVVITDLGMPYMDGRKVAKEIKEISPTTPVILLTGWGQRLIEEGDLPQNVDKVLSKPPKIREIREALVFLERSSEKLNPLKDEN